jgi:hypothetical protein
VNPGIFILGGGVGLLGAIVAGSIYYEKRRREALEQYCLTRGYRFEQERPGAEGQLIPICSLFDRGHSRKWRLTVTGSVGGRPFTAFEYRYTTGGGKSSQVHIESVMLWDSPDLKLPKFSLSPEGFFNRIGQKFGVQDFDFDEDPEFSKAYQLQGDNEAAVRALFTGTRRRLLMMAAPDTGRRTRHMLAGAGTKLLWWQDMRLPVDEKLDAFLTAGDQVYRAFLG